MHGISRVKESVALDCLYSTVLYPAFSRIVVTCEATLVPVASTSLVGVSEWGQRGGKLTRVIINHLVLTPCVLLSQR